MCVSVWHFWAGINILSLFQHFPVFSVALLNPQMDSKYNVRCKREEKMTRMRFWWWQSAILYLGVFLKEDTTVKNSSILFLKWAQMEIGSVSQQVTLYSHKLNAAKLSQHGFGCIATCWILILWQCCLLTSTLICKGPAEPRPGVLCYSISNGLRGFEVNNLG